MSTPNNGGYEPYPEHPRGSHPENDGYYDYDAFEVNTAAQMAGNTALRFHGEQLTDNVPGDGTSPHPINDPANNGWSHVKGTGKLDILGAIAWGFKTVFANAKLWLPLGAAYLLLTFAGLFVPLAGPFIQMIGLLLFVPWLFGAALQQTLVRDLGYGDVKSPTFGKTLGMTALLVAIFFVVFFVLFGTLTVGAMTQIDVNALPDDPQVLMDDPELFFELFGPVFAAMGIAALVALLISPFVMLQMWYAADNNGTFGQAFGAGFKQGARNYLRLLGLAVLFGLINIVATIPFGAGLVLTVPATLLALAYAYRQVSAGPVPTA